MPAETHVEQGPIGRQEIVDLVRDRLADILEIEPSSIHEGDSFAEDLEDLKTVRDAIDYVHARVG